MHVLWNCCYRKDIERHTMTKEEMLRIAKEEKERFLFLKSSCDSCVPDELIEWINEVINLIEKMVML